MRTIFLTVLFLVIPVAFVPATSLAFAATSTIPTEQPEQLNGNWNLRAVQCLDPLGPRYARPDANARWSFANGDYDMHFDASEDGRYPQCRDLSERGIYRVVSQGGTFRIEFAAMASTSCERSMVEDGREKNLNLKESADRPNQTFELKEGVGGYELFQDYDSTESCKRMRFIYAQAPSV